MEGSPCFGCRFSECCVVSALVKRLATAEFLSANGFGCADFQSLEGV